MSMTISKQKKTEEAMHGARIQCEEVKSKMEQRIEATEHMRVQQGIPDSGCQIGECQQELGAAMQQRSTVIRSK